MSCNVPVLAWDPGVWADPKAARYESREVPASSVPYFSPDCGLTFREVSKFPERLDAFLASVFQPRSYVLANLDLEESARQYLRLLEEVR